MGKTFAEKALARAAGLTNVVAGQIVDAAPDVALSHDNTAAISKIFRSLGVERVKYPDRLAIALDHAVPAPTTVHATNHAETRRFVDEQGITNFFEVGRGICHQVLSEEAIVLPGQLILGADSHTTHFGWMGAFGAGIGRSEMAAIWATGELWLRVPESIKITVDGELPPGVTSKDLALRIIGDLGADGGLYASVEFHGSTIHSLSVESRMVIPNMMAEFGVKNAYLVPDAAIFEWLAPRRQQHVGQGQAVVAQEGDARVGDAPRSVPFAADGEGRYGERPLHERPLQERPAAEGSARASADGVQSEITPTSLATSLQSAISQGALYPDSDATYIATYLYVAAALEPYVACPHRVDNVKPLSAVRGTRVQQAFIGTCTNGRIEDLAAAAAILRGQTVARGTRLLVIPASSQVLSDALRLGYIQTFVEAGGVIGTPGCGPCMGNHMGVPAPGEVTISTANRNFRGRMGTREAEIYLASPAVVAASAIAGVIADPRETK